MNVIESKKLSKAIASLSTENKDYMRSNSLELGNGYSADLSYDGKHLNLWKDNEYCALSFFEDYPKRALYKIFRMKRWHIL